jgi:hypothetical protein
MIVDHSNNEMKLDIWRFRVGVCLQESASFSEIRSYHTETRFAIQTDLLQEAARAGKRSAEQVGVFGLVDEDVIDVVLEIAPDARQVLHHIDTAVGQVSGIADASR